jgi:hypothetical protein
MSLDLLLAWKACEQFENELCKVTPSERVLILSLMSATLNANIAEFPPQDTTISDHVYREAKEGWRRFMEVNKIQESQKFCDAAPSPYKRQRQV